MMSGQFSRWEVDTSECSVIEADANQEWRDLVESDVSMIKALIDGTINDSCLVECL